jgi:hypothetical protein
VPLAAWAVSTAAVVGACIWSGHSPFDLHRWTYGDASLYLDIARGGYTLFPCGPDWCGDAGWFPAFPWVVGGLHLIGLPLRPTAVAVAWFCDAATLVTLWLTFLGRRPVLMALAALLYAAFAPGLVYDLTAYPLSLLALSTLLHLWFLSTGRLWAAGLAGAVAALSYPAGVVLPAVAAVWLLTGPEPLRERLRRTAIVSGLTSAGIAVFAVDQKLEVGRWNAYFLVQRKYGHEFEEPFGQVINALHILRRHSPFRLENAPAVQTVLVTAVLVCGLAAVLMRRPVGRVDLLVAVWAIASWVVPQSQTNVQSYRIEAALLPLALLVRRLPPALAIGFVAVAVPVAVAVAVDYFKGLLL